MFINEVCLHIAVDKLLVSVFASASKLHAKEKMSFGYVNEGGHVNFASDPL